MLYSFISMDNLLFKYEVDIINILYDYDLLKTFNLSVRKIFIYNFVKYIEKELHDNSRLLIYHDMILSDDHELFTYFKKEDVEKLINKITKSLNKVTHKVFILNKNKKFCIPQQAKMEDLDGEVIDELIVLDYQKPVDPKGLKKFLDKHYLSEIYKDLSKKIY